MWVGHSCKLRYKKLLICLALVVHWTCTFKERLLEIVTPRYLVWETWTIGAASMQWLKTMGFFLLVILKNSHLLSSTPSAYNFTLERTRKGKSFMYNRKRSGASTVPWGTPDDTGVEWLFTYYLSWEWKDMSVWSEKIHCFIVNKSVKLEPNLRNFLIW